MTPFCMKGEGVPVRHPNGKEMGYCIASAYARYMRLLAPDDWMVAMDHDIALVTSGWHAMVEDAIEQQPLGTFTCVTNRLVRSRNAWQMTPPGDEWETDIVRHMKRASELKATYGSELLDVTDIEDTGAKPLAGIFLVISKATWEAICEIPLDTYAVDWEVHRRVRAIGTRVYLMQGLYVAHFSGYRQHYKEEVKG
jgi:hypothetical protein